MSNQPKNEDAFYLGLDLGQSNDYSALVILRRIGSNPDTATFRVEALKRYALKTPYPDIVQHITHTLRRPELRGQTLLIDRTGVGAAVTDLFKKANLNAQLKPVFITGGTTANRTDDGWNVPKLNLISGLQLLLQSGRLHISPQLALAEVLTAELANFREKRKASGHTSFEAWRESDHDDLVLALGLAIWGASLPPVAQVRWQMPKTKTAVPFGYAPSAAVNIFDRMHSLPPEPWRNRR